MQYYVNKLTQNVGLETRIWRQIVTSQTAPTKYKWPPYATEWNPHETFLLTPLLTSQGVRHSWRTPAGLQKLVIDKARAITAACFCSCDLRCSRALFYSLVVSIWQSRVCAIPGAHLQGSIARSQSDMRSGCFCNCDLRCGRAECVLLLGFNVIFWQL